MGRDFSEGADVIPGWGPDLRPWLLATASPDCDLGRAVPSRVMLTLRRYQSRPLSGPPGFSVAVVRPLGGIRHALFDIHVLVESAASTACCGVVVRTAELR
jgi:hypothetical protein